MYKGNKEVSETCVRDHIPLEQGLRLLRFPRQSNVLPPSETIFH